MTTWWRWNLRRLDLVCLGALPVLVFLQMETWGAVSQYASRPDDWFSSAEGKRVTANILSWQTPHGSWPKNLDTTSRAFTGEVSKLEGTFDNGATTGELRYLARAFVATGEQRCRQAFLKGLDHILKAQYPTGGWPQFYPPPKGYNRHITFNDNTMVRLMQLVREVARLQAFDFVDRERRDRAAMSFELGIQCILKCQVVLNGRLTVWCAQHDEANYQPRGARAYELPSLSGAESAGILELLMSLEKPSPEVARAIKAGAEWFNTARVTGIRVVARDGSKRAIKDPSAPPLWARFYDLETGEPMFADRDGIKKFDFNQLGDERRNGYAWYGDWGVRVEKAYDQWSRRMDPSPVN